MIRATSLTSRPQPDLRRAAATAQRTNGARFGKTCDLAFGFMGGLNAWRKFQPDKFTDDEVEKFKGEWRAAHPATVKFWHNIDRAAVLAVRERGQIVRCGRIDLKCTGAFLQLKLPSGRKISYPQPRIIEDERGKHRVVFADNADGSLSIAASAKAPMAACGPKHRLRHRPRSAGRGDAARRAAGYPIVLHVHDEIVCEVPLGFGSTEEFTRLMTRKPSWALELPIAASAWTARATANEEGDPSIAG